MNNDGATYAKGKRCISLKGEEEDRLTAGHTLKREKEK